MDEERSIVYKQSHICKKKKIKHWKCVSDWNLQSSQKKKVPVSIFWVIIIIQMWKSLTENSVEVLLL